MNNNITNTQKIEGLCHKLHEEMDSYCQTRASQDIYGNGECLKFALMDSFFAAISYLPDYFEEEDLAEISYSEGMEDKVISLDEIVGFFNTHTLHECAETFLSFNHMESFDPFGFCSYNEQLDTLIAVIKEIQKDDSKNKEAK